MRSKLIKCSILAAGMALLLAGCPRIDETPKQTDFAKFVKSLIAQTADNTEPTHLSTVDLKNIDDESEGAFSDVLAY